MKNVALLIFLFLFISCEKNTNFISPNEIPVWLKDVIQQDEQTIKDNPNYYKSFGAWFRFDWNGTYYFQYQNIMSSLILPPVSEDRDTLNVYDSETSNKYYKERCCMRNVWKGPHYDDLPH
jgi:hypothetical protein